jgi:hypothetical protein
LECFYLELGGCEGGADASLLPFFRLLQRRHGQGTDVVVVMVTLLVMRETRKTG